MANSITSIHSNVVSPSPGLGRSVRRTDAPTPADPRPRPAEQPAATRPAAPIPAAREANRVAEMAKETQQQLKEALSGLNALVQGLHRELHFALDEHTGDMKIQVIDKQTDEVVREIPPEELQRVRQHLEETAGVIFRDEA